jgi:hypothetical protein
MSSTDETFDSYSLDGQKEIKDILKHFYTQPNLQYMTLSEVEGAIELDHTGESVTLVSKQNYHLSEL